ncbi:HAMP domain-containing histidine kinase [Fulvivirga sp. 29W222]|uniref:histidine kinase n=1 Tax=Fulvivirga marina TaxID=2494733 RepID=A0A937FZ39_9BACT|nr:HAMP domain-containing sensor histidine kinase [Fulvivirga marina]MBL6445556.1 HAMP domain-containing histidine kinase [Fulvivirga marina]
MEPTALMYSKSEGFSPRSLFFNLKEIICYVFYRHVYRFCYKSSLILAITAKPCNKRTRITIKNELPWVNYCISRVDKTIENIGAFNKASNHHNMEYLNLRQTVDGIVRKRKRLATMVGVEIEVSIKREIFIYMNREIFEIIIRNILDNAIQYSDDKKRKKIVYINAIENWEHLFISIKDNGIGIPDKEAGKIFRMFYKVAPSSPGVGAGLYLAKKAIEKVKGSIDVVSSVGLGSEFLINLPSVISILQPKRIIEKQSGPNNSY